MAEKNLNIPFLSLKDITALHRDELMQAVGRVAESGWYLQSDENKAFQTEFAHYCNKQYCVTCANGLDALTLMLRAYKERGQLHDGDEVLVPANTYIATILAVSANGLVPVLVEPEAETLVLDASEMERHISARTRALLLVHLYGRNAYNDRIGQLCREHSLLLLVDAAQAHGIPNADADCVAYSFYPGKNLGAFGDAGAVVTDDDDVAAVVRTLANYGSNEKYVFEYKGMNSRMDEINAAVLRVKLPYLDEENDRRRTIAASYYDNIHNSLISLPRRLADADCVYHLFPILCRERDVLQSYLKDKGIGTLIHYPIPPHRQQAYAEWSHLSLPVTEMIAECELSLPLSPALGDREVRYVIDALNEFRA